MDTTYWRELRARCREEDAKRAGEARAGETGSS